MNDLLGVYGEFVESRKVFCVARKARSAGAWEKAGPNVETANDDGDDFLAVSEQEKFVTLEVQHTNVLT